MTEPISNIDFKDDDLVQYLIITTSGHSLSSSLHDAKWQVQVKRPEQVSIDDMNAAELIFIFDSQLSNDTRSTLLSQLSILSDKFCLVLSDDKDHISFWNPFVDSVFHTETDFEQQTIINRVIESIELQGMICVDFTDVYSMFRNMRQSYLVQGSAIGTDRATQAIDDAIDEQTRKTQLPQAKTALMLMHAGINFTLDEFEAATHYLEQLLPSEVCCMFGHRIDPTQIDTPRFDVVIFINQ